MGIGSAARHRWTRHVRVESNGRLRILFGPCLHVCAPARREAVDTVASTLEQNPRLSNPDRAAVRVARAIARVPAAVDEEVRAGLLRRFSARDAEAIVLAVAMMGWLNKAMDALGVPLEEATAAEIKQRDRTVWMASRQTSEWVRDRRRSSTRGLARRAAQPDPLCAPSGSAGSAVDQWGTPTGGPSSERTCSERRVTISRCSPASGAVARSAR